MKAIVEEQFDTDGVMTGTNIDITFGKLDMMDLDTILAPVILAGLRSFKAHERKGHPLPSADDYPHGVDLTKIGSLSDEEHEKLNKAWEWILDEMIHGFSYLYEDTDKDEYTKEADERAYNGIVLFGKYYKNLWD